MNNQVNSDGFAQVRLPSTERVNSTQISLIFSAYSSDGLLYFRGNQSNGDFVCLELRNGRVVYKVNELYGKFVKIVSENFLDTFFESHKKHIFERKFVSNKL